MRHGDTEILWHGTTDGRDVTVNMPEARLWDIDTPALYDMRVVMGKDTLTKHFGFRSFEVRDIDGDRMFFLNGRRITLRTAISWSFWPDNGMTPSGEMAVKQVMAAKALGLVSRVARCLSIVDYQSVVSRTSSLTYMQRLTLKL